MDDPWEVTAIYCPKPRERRTYKAFGYQIETFTPPNAGQEWHWTVNARGRESAIGAVKRAYCMRGIEEEFQFVAAPKGLTRKILEVEDA